MFTYVETFISIVFTIASVFLCPVLSCVIYDKIEVDRPIRTDRISKCEKYILFLISVVLPSRVLIVILAIITGSYFEPYSLIYMIISLLFSIIMPMIIKASLVRFGLRININKKNEK